MGAETKIEWADHTWSPWRGCEHASLEDGTEHPGCAHCYAEAMSRRNPKVLGEWGPEGQRPEGVEKYWNLPFSWNRDAVFDGVRESVFPSLMDPFEDRPDLIPLRERMFSVIDDCRQLDFLLLTKRPQNVRKLWPGEKRSRPNVRLLYSASDQLSLKSGIRALIECCDLVPILGLSLEPLLGEIDLVRWFPIRKVTVPAIYERVSQASSAISWVIVGGESGPHARPMDLTWARSIRDQCQAAGVPFFLKQWGEFAPCERWAPGSVNLGDLSMKKVGKHAAGRILDGRTWDETPNGNRHDENIL